MKIVVHVGVALFYEIAGHAELAGVDVIIVHRLLKNSMAASEYVLLATYMDGYERFRKDSNFTSAEQEVVFLTISRFNGCEYCLAAHSFLADQMSKVPRPVIDAIRADQPVPDAKLAALSTFTALMFATRGLPSTAGVQAFLDAGYSERHVLEIILAIAVKTLSNYANHLLHTPLDSVFAPRAWEAPGCACETGHGR